MNMFLIILTFSVFVSCFISLEKLFLHLTPKMNMASLFFWNMFLFYELHSAFKYTWGQAICGAILCWLATEGFFHKISKKLRPSIEYNNVKK